MRENILLRPEYHRNIREAKVSAKWMMRTWDREFGGYGTQTLLSHLDMCRWMAERIRIEGPALPADDLTSLHQHLLSKLSMIELAVIKMAGTAVPADTGSS